MTHLTPMRFGAFCFPCNPAALQVEHSAMLREALCVDGTGVLQQIGRQKRRVSGRGYFTGEDAMTRYLQLEAMFGETHTLFLPGRAPFPAVLHRLTLLGVQDPDVVEYRFGFTETAAEEKSSRPCTYLAKGGESLWDYAYYSGVSVDRLRQANPHIRCITALQAGERVFVP